MNQRAKLLLLVTLFLVPTIASFIVFYFFPPGKTTNYGLLVSPVVELPNVRLKSLNSGGEDLAQGLRGKWLMLTRDSGACATACRNKLLAMRQARLILGREQDRILRVVLVDDDVKPSDQLQKDFAGTIWISAKSLSWLEKLPAATEDADGRNSIYAVDTLGNIFMRYGPEPDIKKLSNDLRRVLKASQIG